jgi:hypothetical protein
MLHPHRQQLGAVLLLFVVACTKVRLQSVLFTLNDTSTTVMQPCITTWALLFKAAAVTCTCACSCWHLNMHQVFCSYIQ